MFNLPALRDADFSWNNALSCALASELSYSEQTVVRNVAVSEWGFQRCDFLSCGDTRCFVASDDEVVVAAFRGTESLGDWLGHLDAAMTEWPHIGNVHRGFFDAYVDIAGVLAAAMTEAQAAEKKVWFTGHSLGGALAVIAATELNLFGAAGRAVSTYGQPRMGDGMLEAFYADQFSDGLFRFVNENDIVSRVPPGFHHPGLPIALSRFDENHEKVGKSDEVMEPHEFEAMQAQIEKTSSALSRRAAEFGVEALAAPQGRNPLDTSIEGIIPGVTAHRLSSYIAAIRRNVRKTQVDPGIVTEQVFRKFVVPEVMTTVSETIFVVDSGAETTGESIPASSTTAPELFPAVLRLRDSHWQAPPHVNVQAQIGAFASVRASRSELDKLRQDPMISEIHASRDGGTLNLDQSMPFVSGDVVHRPPLDERGDAALIGIIDTGVDVLHEAFLAANGVSRIVAIWDQRATAGPTPADVDPVFKQSTGRLYTAADIASFVGGATTPPSSLRDPEEHGTHVAGIAAGRAVGALPDGMAPEARLVVVIPNLVPIQGAPQSVGYSSSHIEALDFLHHVAKGSTALLAQAHPMVVNASFGMNAGAHDGMSALEAQFDTATGLGREPGFVIVKSAGNERGHGGHARTRPFPGEFEITWKSGSGLRMRDYFEVWYSKFHKLSFVLRDPSGQESPEVSEANPNVSTAINGAHLRLTLDKLHSDNGEKQLKIEITSMANAIATGVWTLRVVGHEIPSMGTPLDIWVERQNMFPRPIRFDNDVQDVTLSIPATADTVIAVAACEKALPLKLADFSSFGPTRNDKPKPDLCAPGIGIRSAASNRPDHTADRSDSGTSMAAPHVAGALALAMSFQHKENPTEQFNAQQLRTELNKTARFSTGVHHNGIGYGLLDAERLFRELCMPGTV